MRNTQFRAWNIWENTEKRGKWEMLTVGIEIWRENWHTRKMRNINYGEKHWKTCKIRNTHCRTWNMSRKLKKRGKCETHTIGSGIWRENWQTRKIKNSHGMTCNMARNTEKRAKWNTNCRTWNMMRNSEKREILEINNIGPVFWQKSWKTWKMRRKNCMTWNMRMNTEKRKKGEMHTLGSGIWQENW